MGQSAKSVGMQALGWGLLAGACALMSGAILTSCNQHTAEYSSITGAVQGRIKTNVSGQVPLDILWVIDNSFSMCQEQKVLRENFKNFIAEIKKESLDFHIAVTTTHAPSHANSVEPVARFAHIQSTPQPVPGPELACRATMDEIDPTKVKDYAPFRSALDVAFTCLEDPAAANKFDWTDAQIACAYKGGQCPAGVDGVDTNNDGVFDQYDLLPAISEYRTIPKVLRAKDYRDASGVLDADRLEADFACMSFVGTLGDGVEKGLKVAVEAVSLNKTGGAVDNNGMPVLETSDMSAPNHGFIRKDAGFALVFVTDENDCSYDGDVQEIASACGRDFCAYLNADEASNDVLTPIDVLADRLKSNLNEIKGRTVTESEILVASIHGQWKRLTGPVPDCEGGEMPAVTSSCSSDLGEAYSGDRYERFIRQFQNFYPNAAVTQEKAANPNFDVKNDFSVRGFGWMCASGSFSPALEAIGQLFAKKDRGCITENVFPCLEDADCPDQLYGTGSGSCVEYPDDNTKKYCSTGVVLKIERNPDVGPEGALHPDITENPYCQEGSINKFRSPNPSCLVDSSFYSLVGCEATTGISFVWNESEELAEQKLSGYSLEFIYNASFGDAQTPAQ